MPRVKRKEVWEQSVKELLAKHDLNPLEELIKLTRPIALKDGDEEFIGGMMDDYQMTRNEQGERFLVPKLKHLKDIWSELAQYCSPKLRATETKGQIDYNFHISFKRFDDDPKLINVNVKAIPEKTDEH